MTDNSSAFLPYGRHGVDEDDIRAVADVLRSDFLTTGPMVPKLEAALSERLDGAHVVVCSNGTAALHIMAMALPLNPGDVLIVPAVTFLATANAARYAGAEVEFADVDPDTGLLTVAALEAAIAHAEKRFGRRPRAATVVHLGGQVGNLLEISAAAQKHGIILMEDAAHAIGTRYRSGNDWLQVGGGAHSSMAAFSFHPVKTMTMGEGGAVSTRDPVLARRLALLRNHGMERDPGQWEVGGLGFDEAGTPLPWYYEMQEPGFNYRATDMQAALGLSQLDKLSAFIQRRKDLVGQYRAALASLAPWIIPVTQHADCDASWHLFVVRIDFAALGSREGVMKRLHAAGIGTQVHYIPLHKQPYYRKRYGEIHLPGAENYYGAALSLPLFPAMMDGDVDRVVSALASLVEAARR